MSKTSIEPCAEAGPLVRRALNGPAMGSRWSAVAFVAADRDTTPLHRALAEAVEEVEAQMSTWRPMSDLMRLNRAAPGQWQPIPAGLFDVLEASLAIGDLSGGAFDVGVGDLVQAWGFGPGAGRPDLERIGAIGGRPSLDAPKTLELDPVGRRARRHTAATIDLSGIAKGHGVDRMAAVMAAFGVGSYLVGIDGEMRAAGCKPDGGAWAVGQERPDRDGRDLLGVLELRDAAVATSGDYRHVVDVGGRTVSHTMDPRTGRPAASDLAQVTVVADTCMVADAWATALLVMGGDAALATARRLGLATVLVGHDGAVRSTL